MGNNRLLKEYREAVTAKPDPEITLCLADETDIFLWTALLKGPQGTPYPRGETVQAVLDSADEASEDEVEGLPVEALLPPPRGSVDFGPREEEYSSEGYDGEEDSSGSDVDA